uniref:Neuronal differentiation 1 n=1 Tax=Serinus canaria TaxID=9135 RepID=A0A8C9KXG3_SERCA
MTKSYSESGLMGEPQPQGPPSWTDECLSSQDEEHEVDKKEEDLEGLHAEAEEDSLRNGEEEDEEDDLDEEEEEEEEEEDDDQKPKSLPGPGPAPRERALRPRRGGSRCAFPPQGRPGPELSIHRPFLFPDGKRIPLIFTDYSEA